MRLRSSLRRGFVAPIIIAFLATWPIEALLIAIENPLDRLAMMPINWVGRRMLHPYVEITAQRYPWQVFAVEAGTAVVGIAGLWILAHWIYKAPDMDIESAAR